MGQSRCVGKNATHKRYRTLTLYYPDTRNRFNQAHNRKAKVVNTSSRDRRVGNARLLKLCTERLDTLPPGRYNHSHWVGGDWGGKTNLSCGTTACAMGWATTIPSFRRLGLKLDPVHRRIIYGDSWGGFPSAMRLFHITYDDAERLFGHAGWGKVRPTARRVARRIRQFVKDNPA